MSPELEERRREFESAMAEFVELVAGVDDTGFNRRPAEGSWSMAECIDHLVSVGRKLIPPMRREVERGRARGRLASGPFRYSRWGDWFVRQSGADELPPRRRFKTLRLYRPRPGRTLSIAESLTNFKALQDDFVALSEAADGLDLARIKVSSPAFRLLRLSLGQWLKMLASHQRRHLWQARQARERLGL